MYYIIQYLKHFVSATNQHGVHSPFVYDYITKCLYAKSNFKGSKTDKVVLKSIPYFRVEKYKIISKTKALQKRIETELNLLSSEEIPIDLLYCDEPEMKLLQDYRDKIQNDSVFIIGNIYKNEDNKSLWKAAKEHDLVQVSIDLFYCGMLFFRKEQAKEHFKIRI